MASVSSGSITTLSLSGSTTVSVPAFLELTGQTQLSQLRSDSVRFTALHVNALPGKTRTFMPKGGTGQDNLLLLGVS